MLEGAPEFETELLPRIRALPCFREPSAAEIDASWAAYRSGDFDALCDTWARVAEPTRARVPRHLKVFYDRARWLPPICNGLLFLASVRAALAAGVAARRGFSPHVRECIATEFPWLERRHEHIPAGYTPPFAFPEPFLAFVEANGRPLADVRGRWQLTTALNEVQQTVYSAHAAERFGLPALARHAERERELALNYFGHWAPACTRELWAQCIYVLDALNAAVFDLIVRGASLRLVGNSLRGALFRRGEWAAFEAGLDLPQVLVPLDPGR